MVPGPEGNFTLKQWDFWREPRAGPPEAIMQQSRWGDTDLFQWVAHNTCSSSDALPFSMWISTTSLLWILTRCFITPFLFIHILKRAKAKEENYQIYLNANKIQYHLLRWVFFSKPPFFFFSIVKPNHEDLAQVYSLMNFFINRLNKNLYWRTITSMRNILEVCVWGFLFLFYIFSEQCSQSE